MSLSLVPRTHVRWLTTIYHSESKGIQSHWPHGHPHLYSHAPQRQRWRDRGGRGREYISLCKKSMLGSEKQCRRFSVHLLLRVWVARERYASAHTFMEDRGQSWAFLSCITPYFIEAPSLNLNQSSVILPVCSWAVPGQSLCALGFEVSSKSAGLL